MSEGGAGSLLTTAIFNPALLRKEDLVRGFVARQDLLERLLDDLRRIQPGTPPQHQLVIGQRGLGKTTLLRRLAFAIEDDPQLSATWKPLVFPEEQYNVKNLGDFWLNCADALSDALDRVGEAPAAEALDQKVERAPLDPERRSAAALALLTEEAERLGRGLVLLVDNLDIVLDRLDEKEEWEFRRVISAEHRLYFIGASSRALEALYEHGRAFYDYFQVHDLKGLSDAEMFAVLGRLAEEAGDKQVQRLIRERPSRVRALRVLTGGNPRTLMLLYRVLAQGPEGDVQRDMEQLLDLYTPLYKARFEEMATQAQQVVDAMAIHWDPITAGDLAEKLAPLSVNQVSAQLKRLEDFGIVEKAPWFGEKKTAFQIAERFFNIWYLMRASRRVRRRLIWLVKFLESWFEREEIGERARAYLGRDPSLVGKERYAEMALAQFDFSDLPPEVQDRKERMGRLRELRDRVMGLRLEDVEPAELWHLLGGSPHLSLEEKAKVVDELPTLGTAQVRELYAKLKHTERRLTRTYREQSAEIVRLYESLASGEMADVYDVEGSLAVADRWQCGRLPVVAIASRINTAPEKIPEDELKIAERALRALTSEAGYEAKAWNALGNLLHNLMRYEEAEQAYHRSIELDSQDAYPWNNLGSLLRDQGRYGEAEGAFQRAIKLDPDNAHPWNNLGTLLYSRPDRYDEAERAFRRAIELDPKTPTPWNNLGHILKNRLGRHEEAEQAYRRAIELDPQYPHSWIGLGNLLHDHLGRYDEAEQAYRRAIELDPQSPYPWGNLARLLQRDSLRQREALAAFITAAERDPANDWRLSQALRIAGSMGIGPHLPAALEAVSRLHEYFPEDKEVEFVRFGLLARSGEWAGARALLEELAANEVEQPDTWAFGAAVGAGHVDDVIALFEQTGANERWRPLYEALRAVQAGSAEFLRRVAPEIRTIAEQILNQIAPDLKK